MLELLIKTNEKDFFKDYNLSYCLPVVEKNTRVLTFREHIDERHLVVGKFNIKEPSSACPIAYPNLIFVPLLSFDAKKNRLGYGKGYYDNTLRNLKEKK